MGRCFLHFGHQLSCHLLGRKSSNHEVFRWTNHPDFNTKHPKKHFNNQFQKIVSNILSQKLSPKIISTYLNLVDDDTSPPRCCYRQGAKGISPTDSWSFGVSNQNGNWVQHEQNTMNAIHILNMASTRIEIWIPLLSQRPYQIALSRLYRNFLQIGWMKVCCWTVESQKWWLTIFG